MKDEAARRAAIARGRKSWYRALKDLQPGDAIWVTAWRIELDTSGVLRLDMESSGFSNPGGTADTLVRREQGNSFVVYLYSNLAKYGLLFLWDGTSRFAPFKRFIAVTRESKEERRNAYRR